ncbi:hypothetical protein AVEN_12443-1 [Araneus ventricosus]|uniref:Uncharacterized protein n=1 Tax=Araneus ventricosus TaxID=182803 RepID=A0A4Y2M893_ARAVE|nr:hypothetical protein AVEN_12443-1 [Araneus ventricosus]
MMKPLFHSISNRLIAGEAVTFQVQTSDNRNVVDLDCKAGDPALPVDPCLPSGNCFGIDYRLLYKARDVYNTSSATRKLGAPLEDNASFQTRIPTQDLHSMTNFTYLFTFFT